MMEIAEILHNIADHTETFYRFLSEPGVADDIRGRLIDHIILEEKENTVALQELHNVNPTALTQKMLDHSFVLQRVMNDASMPLDLKQELLHHFMEEHAEWQTMVLGTPTGHAQKPGTAGSAASAATFLQEGTDGTSYGARGGIREHAAHGAHGSQSSHSVGAHGGHSGSREHHQTKPNQPAETNQWTVGPLWNQGG
ncbi:hypothetical protein KF728_19085 [Candidatus Obscuribacterales bacterium]|nr:hypothetical protein [Candidatus Obscuribacterales bacterium]